MVRVTQASAMERPSRQRLMVVGASWGQQRLSQQRLRNLAGQGGQQRQSCRQSVVVSLQILRAPGGAEGQHYW